MIATSSADSPRRHAERIFKRRGFDDQITAYVEGVTEYRRQLDDLSVLVLRARCPYEYGSARAHAWLFGWEDAVSGKVGAST